MNILGRFGSETPMKTTKVRTSKPSLPGIPVPAPTQIHLYEKHQHQMFQIGSRNQLVSQIKNLISSYSRNELKQECSSPGPPLDSAALHVFFLNYISLQG